jgi:histone acetyltransferase 1
LGTKISRSIFSTMLVTCARACLSLTARNSSLSGRQSRQTSRRFSGISYLMVSFLSRQLDENAKLIRVAVAFQKKADFELALKNLGDSWSPPPGLELVNSFGLKSGNYEIWKGNLASAAVKQLMQRFQILALFFIEGGSMIDLEEADNDRWTVYFLYQKVLVPGQDDKFSYVFSGYSTVYKFFFFQLPTPPTSPKPRKELVLDDDFDIFDRPCKTRISQFVILPPFQRKGLGPKLYSTIYDEYLDHPQTVELTVEDPNEAFDDLRDVSDLIFLRTTPEFSELQINKDIVIDMKGNAPTNIVDKAMHEACRKKYKIALRQFSRVLEMNLMSKLPESIRTGMLPEKSAAAPATPKQRHEYRLWQLLVKQRIYRQSKDVLGQLDIPERIAKLDETLSSVEFEYARILDLVEKREGLPAPNSNQSKRKLDEGEASASKKARVDSADES